MKTPSAGSIWRQILPESIFQKLQGRATLRKVLANIFWLSIDKVIRLVLGLLIGVWVVRYLGPERFGTLNFALSFVAIFAPLYSLGLEGFVVRDLVAQTQEKHKIIGTAFTLKFLGALLILPLSQALLAVIRPGEKMVTILVAIASITSMVQTFEVIDYWFQSRIQSKNTVIARNIAFFIISGLKVLFIQLGASVLAFGWLGFAESFLAGLFLLGAYHRSGENSRHWYFSYEQAIRLLTESWPYFCATCFSMIYSKADQVIIGKYLNDYDLGLYAAVGNILGIPFILMVMIATSVYPKLTEIYCKDIRLFQMRYAQITRYFSGMAIGMVVVCFVLSNEIVHLFFGTAFQGAGPILKIQSIAAAIGINAGLRSAYLTITGNQKILLHTSLLSAIINVLGNILVIPRYGLLGAAIVAVATQCFSLWVSNLFFPSVRRLFWVHVRALAFWKENRSF